MGNQQKRLEQKRKRREYRKQRAAKRASDHAAGRAFLDGRIPGTLAPLVYRGECECGGDMVFVENTIEDCTGCNEVSRDLLDCAMHYLRRCSKCGAEDLYHMTTMTEHGRPPLPGDDFEYEHRTGPDGSVVEAVRGRFPT